MPIIRRLASTLNLFDDVARFSCPDEGFRLRVLAVNRIHQEAAIRSSILRKMPRRRLGRETAEGSLDHVAP